ncbi:hypothetical protein B0H66DRAFT_598937 [Apodospora peruviana]|uniref:Uncharacterized protein n=1 Tax=Apodospora peruviana TaxID=516989 RepID=A0AAE0MG93_9PEZI|nr:hypothetical protein B0H66DRAFT_598937 [Apodospora peruviana]
MASSSPGGGGGAHFISDGLPAVQSYPSCYVFGDSSLYGVGIRTSYYLQYLAAVLSILFLRGQDLISPWLFLSFVPLVAANFVALTISSTATNGLVVLDWAIVFGLVFWSIVFLARAVFYKPAGGSSLLWYQIDAPSRAALRQDLAKETGRVAVSDQEVEWDRRYVAVIKVLGAEGSGSRKVTGNDAARHAALQRPLQEYADAFASARGSPVFGEAANHVLTLYEDEGRTRDIVGRMIVSNTDVGSFRDAHAEALRLANVPFDQARVTTQALAKIAMEELYPGPVSYPPRSARQVMADFEAWAGTSGLVGCGLALFLYAGYLAFTIWVLFRGIDHGAKRGCDVRIIFFVVPVSIYNRAALTALRVLACIWFALVGVPALLLGIGFLVLAIVGWWTGATVAQRRGVTRMTKKVNATGFKAVAYDAGGTAEKGKGATTAVASTSAPQFPGVFRGSRASDMFFDAVESPQASTALVQQQEKSKGASAGHFDDPALEEYNNNTTGPGIRGGGPAAGSRSSGVAGRMLVVARSKLEWILVLPLVHTVVVVELTILINKLDMGKQRTFTSTGELLAFFLGAFLLLRVLGRCLLSAADGSRKRRSARWFEERWRVLTDPPNRWPDFSGDDISSNMRTTGTATQEPRPADKNTAATRKDSQGVGGGGLQKVYTWQSAGRRSTRSSMGRFKEMMDDDK